MPSSTRKEEYILLPPQGLRAQSTQATVAHATFLSNLATLANEASPTLSLRDGAGGILRVLDSVHEDGAKLVELPTDAVSQLRATQPGLRILPVVYFYPALAPRPTILAKPQALTARAAPKLTLRVVSRSDGKPIGGATVVAFTNFAKRQGASGKTNRQGHVSLGLGKSNTKVERLYIYAEKGYWGGLQRNVILKDGQTYTLQPIDLMFQDALRFFCGASLDTSGAGVKVGVIDTGIAPHPDLTVAGGANTVVGEKPDDYGDNGAGHGTHVAGIISAHGRPPNGIRGLAPAVELRSYRVFGKGAEGASNYAILKAIDQAVADGCDLINMSLGGGPYDPATHEAIADARAHGLLVICAAGNDGRQSVSFPGADSLAIAVSAMGRKNTLPKGAVEWGDVAPPFGYDKQNFIGEFSNIGPEIDLTAPGVGIISTYPGGYAVMDGTSMACPAVTGIAARLLSQRPDILAMDRNQARSDAIASMLSDSAELLGFGALYEGKGLPQSGDV